MKERHVVAFGTDCLTAIKQYKIGIKKYTYPLDWCKYRGNKKTSLEACTDFVCSKFNDFFNIKNFENRGPTGAHGLLLYDTKFDFSFIHEVHEGESFEKMYPELLDKYQRRIKRFLDILNSKDEVVLVHISYEPMGLTEDIVLNCYKKIKNVFPKCDLKFLVFANIPTMNQFEYKIKKPNRKITYIAMNNSEETAVREDHWFRNECIYMKLLYDYFYPKPTKWQNFMNYCKSKKRKREMKRLYRHFFHKAFSFKKLKHLFKTHNK